MDIAGIIDRLTSDGVTITVNGNLIKLVPGSRVSPYLVEIIRANKAEVLDYLMAQSGEATDRGTAPTDVAGLLAWASELAEQKRVLEEAVTFIRRRPRTIATKQVSLCASACLRDIAEAHLIGRSGGCGCSTSKWWAEQELEALGALAALRDAMTGRDLPEANSDDQG